MRLRRAHVLLFGLAVVCLGVGGCAVGAGRVDLQRTAEQQILVTEAIERSLDGLDWPNVQGMSVAVRTGSPGQSMGMPARGLDENYLLRSVEKRLLQNGARIADGNSAADYELIVIAGALGIDRRMRFFGVSGSTGGVIPIAIPELSIYKSLYEEGFAKTEIVLSDAKTGGVAHQSGPSQGATYNKARVFLFIFRKRETDTSRRRPSDGQESTWGNTSD